MKKIGLLTFFESDNYGTVLQAYALSEYFKKTGYDCELLRIKRDVHAKGSVHAAPPQELSFGERLLSKYASMIHKGDGDRKKQKFSDFRKKHIKLSSKIYENGDDLKADLPIYDIYVSGGDQIWNPYHKVFSYHYMWDFLPEDKKIISYGSSFGVSSITDEVFLANSKAFLSKFSAISVREQSGVEILRGLGHNAEHVVDPVFLLYDEWRAMASTESCRRKKKYILVYALVDYSQREKKKIAELARRKGLEVVVLPDSRLNRANLFKKAFDLSPEEFLSMLAGAEYVFTNSFHGLAFSIIFQKQFALLSAATEEGNAKRVRLTDMLSSLGIADRTIDGADDVIDYHAVNAVLYENIQKSKAFLERVL